MGDTVERFARVVVEGILQTVVKVVSEHQCLRTPVTETDGRPRVPQGGLAGSVLVWHVS